MKQVRRGSEDKKKQEIGSMGRIKKPKEAKKNRLFGEIEPKKYQEMRLFNKIIRKKDQLKEAIALDPSVVQMKLPQALLVAVEQIGGHDLVFVGKKELTASDVNKHHDRLFVPKTTALMERLTRDEWKIVQTGDKIVRQKNVKQGGKIVQVDDIRIEAVKIVIVDAMGRIYENMEFKNWSSVDQLVLGSSWNAIVRENRLEKDDRVDLHVFRYESSKLGFAVNAAIRVQPINQVPAQMITEPNDDDLREPPYKFI